MEVSEQILKVLKQTGVPIVLIILVIALVIIYKNYLDIQLTRLQIIQTEKDLAI